MSCERTKEQFPLYIFGELGIDGEEAVDSHLAACSGCRRALEAERKIYGAMDAAHLEVPPELLDSCRQDLIRQVRLETAAKPLPVPGGAFERLVAWAGAPFQGGWMKPAGALALIAIGFLAGRAPHAASGLNGAASDLVATRIRNVEPDANGQVRIVLEETRQRMVSGSAGDSDIRSLLLAAAQDKANPGLRVESVDLLRRDTSAAEVRQALIAALENDSNPGVRLKALEALKPFSGDPDVRRSLAHVLLNDENAGVRTQVVDLLIDGKRKDMAGVLQESLRREDNDYIRLRAQKALLAMNASVDAF